MTSWVPRPDQPGQARERVVAAGQSEQALELHRKRAQAWALHSNAWRTAGTVAAVLTGYSLAFIIADMSLPGVATSDEVYLFPFAASFGVLGYRYVTGWARPHVRRLWAVQKWRKPGLPEVSIMFVAFLVWLLFYGFPQWLAKLGLAGGVLCFAFTGFIVWREKRALMPPTDVRLTAIELDEATTGELLMAVEMACCQVGEARQEFGDFQAAVAARTDEQAALQASLTIALSGVVRRIDELQAQVTAGNCNAALACSKIDNLSRLLSADRRRGERHRQLLDDLVARLDVKPAGESTG